MTFVDNLPAGQRPGRSINYAEAFIAWLPLIKKLSPIHLVANRLQAGSYVSLQYALAFHGMIPEAVHVTTSVTTTRPQSLTTPIGQFDYRHIQTDWFRGYEPIDLGNNQSAFVATGEKALLDLIYLQPKGETVAYLRSLRLQATEQIDMTLLHQLAKASKKPKLLRALMAIEIVIEEESGYTPL